MKIILIGGPTSSGKTTTTDILKKMLPDVEVVIASNFYKNGSSAPSAYDDPEIFDGALLARKVREFQKEGTQEVALPVIKREKDSDGTRHFTRIDNKEIKKVPKDLLIVEGVFALQEKQVRDLADLKVYIYADDDLRLMRKLKRCKEYKDKYGETPADPEEARLWKRYFGETLPEAFDFWTKYVRPSHKDFIEKHKEHADLVLSSNEQNQVWRNVETILKKLNLSCMLPISKLLPHLQNLNSKQPVVLLTQGSMNPIHKQHVNILEVAKKEVEIQSPDSKVIGGFIATTSDDWVKGKLGEEAATLEQRTEMIKLAVKDSNWIDIDEWGSKPTKGIALKTTEHLSTYLNNNPEILKYSQNIKVFYVCGEDLVERDLKRGVKRFKQLVDKGFGAVIVGRNNNPDWKQKATSSLDTIFGSSSWKDSVYLVDGNDNEETSSTKVREKSKSQAESDLAKLLHPEVLEYIESNELYGFKKQKSDRVQQNAIERERERENIWKQPVLYVGLIGGAILLGLGIYWIISKKRPKKH